MRSCRWWACLLTLTLLSGCATTTRLGVSDDPEADWQAHRATLTSLKAWDLRARVAVRTQDRGGSATVLWSLNDTSQTIELYGPLGGGRIKITEDSAGARLVDRKGKIATASNAEEVLYQEVGWLIPFDALRYWIVGLPAPGPREGLQLNPQGQLRTVDQLGWRIGYTEYWQPESVPLPRKMTVEALPGTVKITDEKGEVIGDELKVKLVVKKWSGSPAL